MIGALIMVHGDERGLKLPPNVAPYQVVIVSLEDGSRVTGRVRGERIKIDDRVEQAEMHDGVPFFRKLA